MSPKVTRIVYWIVTGLVSVLFFFSAFMALQNSPEYQEGIRAMGYPDYFAGIHGTLKLLGAIALLVPRRFYLKHWAYAGLMVTLLFAGVAHVQVGEPFVVHIIASVLLLVSYYLYLYRIDFPSLPIGSRRSAGTSLS